VITRWLDLTHVAKKNVGRLDAGYGLQRTSHRVRRVGRSIALGPKSEERGRRYAEDLVGGREVTVLRQVIRAGQARLMDYAEVPTLRFAANITCSPGMPLIPTLLRPPPAFTCALGRLASLVMATTRERA
jgi:hypothetical protein